MTFRRLLDALTQSTLVMLLLFGGSVQGQPAPSGPHGSMRDTGGRMVFDWDGPVQYSADVVNGELIIRFDHPIHGDFHSLLRPLSRFLRDVSVSADHQTASFSLMRPVTVKASSGEGNSVVIDLADADAAPAADGGAPVSLLPNPNAPPPASPPASPSATQAPPPSASAPAPSVARAAGPDAVEMRAGEHGGYNRLVFTWPAAVPYKVEKQGGRAVITFSRAARVDTAAVAGALPADIAVQSAEVGARTTTVVLSVPASSRLRHFASGAKVVVDVVRAAGEPPPAGGARPTPAEGDLVLPSLKPLGDGDKPQLPMASLTAPAAPTAPPAKTAGKTPAKGAEPPPPAAARPEVTPAPTPPPSTAAAPATAVSPAADTGRDMGQVFSLSVSWDKPVAAAVFRRAGYLWVVFDRRQEVDTKLLRRLGGDAVTRIEQIPHRDATVLRLVVDPEFTPSVRRDGLLWVIDLMRQSAEPKEAISVVLPAVLPNGVGISMSVADAGNPISIADPEVGDSVLVVPVIALGAGVYPGRETPDVDLLPTVQGIAMVPHVDNLDVRSTRGTVSIGLANGGSLILSGANDRAGGAGRGTGASGFFDVGTWKRGGPDAFAEERRSFEQSLAQVPEGGRSGAHMEAARFFFANGFAAEALGFLRLAADEEPTLVDTGPFRALRGACELLMGRNDQAMADLDNPLVKDDPESRVWQAAAHVAAADQPATWDKPLAAGLAAIGGYPKPLAWPMAVLAAKAALAAGDDDAAQKSLDVLDRSLISPREEALLDFLHGALNQMSGQFDKAVDDYDHAMQGNNREYRARAAVAETELLLRLGRISPREAADRLDRLRFAWREEDFEFALLRRLAELQVQAGDYPEALRSMRALVTNYPDNKATPDVARLMSDTFTRLYLNGVADSMPPVSSIGLYDEFRDLTPTGAKGDEMIRRLADRLASVDLLDRAADLLKHQVEFRLQGLDKGRVGAQLALLDLLDHQPAAALEAITSSEAPGLPDDLQRQRRHLKARALSDLERVPEAIGLLAGDNSAEAMQLRAEIYWRKQDWPNAAQALEAMVPPPAPGTPLADGTARLVMAWATCLVLGNDERGLAALRRGFADSLAGSPYRDGFDLLTSALDRDVPDMPAIAVKIKEAQGFQSFMENYKKRVQSAGLSAIN